MEKTATLSLLSLPSFPFLICPFWTYRNFQRTHMCVSGFVHWEYRHRPHCALVLCVHCKFEKHRQFGNSNSNELVAFIIFFFPCFFLLFLLSFYCWLVCVTGITMVIVSILLRSPFDFACFPYLKITASGEINVLNLWASLIYLGIAVVHLLNQVLSLLWLLLTP